jgi:hypothetical protein
MSHQASHGPSAKGKHGRKGKRRNNVKQSKSSSRGSNSRDRNISGTLSSAGFSIPSVPLFGQRTRKPIRYYFAGTITSGASTTGTYVISANGAYDPDITGTGSQPMGFDQMMTFYNHYTVLRSRIRVVFKTNSTNLRATVALSVSGSSTATTSIEQLVENGNLTFQVLEFAGAYGGACTLSRAVNTAKFQGIDDAMDDPNMRGDSASNPTEQLYYHLSVWNPASATTLSTDFQVLVEYDTMFHEPRKGSLSVMYVPHHHIPPDEKFDLVCPHKTCNAR